MAKSLIFEHCKKRMRSNSESSSNEDCEDDFDDIIKRFKPDPPILSSVTAPPVILAASDEDGEESSDDDEFKRNTIRFTLKETEALKTDAFARSTVCQVIADNKFICDEVSYCKAFSVENPVVCTTRVQIMRQICKIGRFHHLRINIENEAGESLVIHNM